MSKKYRKALKMHTFHKNTFFVFKKYTRREKLVIIIKHVTTKRKRRKKRRTPPRHSNAVTCDERRLQPLDGRIALSAISSDVNQPERPALEKFLSLCFSFIFNLQSD